MTAIHFRFFVYKYLRQPRPRNVLLCGYLPHPLQHVMPSDSIVYRIIRVSYYLMTNHEKLCRVTFCFTAFYRSKFEVDGFLKSSRTRWTPSRTTKIRATSYPTVLRDFHMGIIRVWCEEKVPERLCNAVIEVLHKTKERQSAGTTAVSLSWHTRVKF